MYRTRNLPPVYSEIPFRLDGTGSTPSLKVMSFTGARFRLRKIIFSEGNLDNPVNYPHPSLKIIGYGVWPVALNSNNLN